MKATVQLTTCPRCPQPLAAYTHGESRAVTWFVSRAGWVDLDSEPLTWCPTCNAALPCQPEPLPAGDESAVTQ